MYATETPATNYQPRLDNAAAYSIHYARYSKRVRSAVEGIVDDLTKNGAENLHYAQRESMAAHAWTVLDYCRPSDLEWLADLVGMEYLKRQGYRVAATADFDWVWDNLGTEVCDVYSEAWQAVEDLGWDGYMEQTDY